jgi:imidazoleglycerol-phosphate dehydratase
MRSARVVRTTKETSIEVEIGLDGTGEYEIHTPLPFLTHMVEQLSRHGLFDLRVRASGDVDIDGHHTTEDLGQVMGEAFSQALGDRKGLARYGFALLPMDEARVAVTLDLSGRPFFVGELALPKAKIGTFDTELCEVFFEAFARGAKCNLHVVKERGDNLHHVVEITFKAFAKALEAASRIDPRVTSVPSTKGTLTS